MPKVYIANCSLQPRVFYYRLDFDPEGRHNPNAPHMRPKRHEIGCGRQIALGNTEFHHVQVQEIVSQLNNLGAVAVSDLPRHKGRVVFLYSVDKPIPAKVIESAHLHASQVAVNQAMERRRRLATAANQALAQTVEAQPPVFEISVEQESVSEADETPIAEGFRVDPTQALPKARPQAGRRPGRPPKVTA